MSQPNLSAKENLQGMVERITFHSAETGFCVLRITAKSHKDLVTLIGHAPVINVGEFIEADGDWHHDRTYGIQFKAARIKIVVPTTLSGIEKYLGSGLIKGIGPHFAKKLVLAFGADVLTIIEQTPQRLKELESIVSNSVKIRADVSANIDHSIFLKLPI